jgi:N-acetylmuramidase
LALSSDGLAGVASALGVHAPEIWAVLAVETKGCGYLPDRRPQILYERHIFHRLTGGRFDDGDISDGSPGGYGPTGAHQYERLAAAIKKDTGIAVRTAALQSASWGLGQIMGENFAAAGFQKVEDMVRSMSQSEDAQLAAMGSFLATAKLRASLQAHDWTTFARRYNGPNFAINRYDVRLNGEFQKFSVGALPDPLPGAAEQCENRLVSKGRGGINELLYICGFQALRYFIGNSAAKTVTLPGSWRGVAPYHPMT